MAKRVKILPLSPWALVEMLKPGRHAWEVTANPLPADAEIVRFHYDHNTDCFWLVLQSDIFPEVPEGDQLMRLPLPIIRNLEEPHREP